MTRILLICTTWLAVSSSLAYGQAVCDGKTENRLDQESYLSLTDRVYIHASDISSSGRGWQAFSLRVLTATYRRPFLLQSAPLKEKDIVVFLRSRPDLRQTSILVPASTASRGTGPRATVRDGERSRNVAITVLRVMPVRGGVDHLFFICGLNP